MKIKTLIVAMIGVFLIIQPVNAQTWTASKRLTWTPTDSYLSSIAVGSNNHIYVMFDDDALGNFEIFYNTSTDEGASWKTKRMTWNSGFSYSAVAALDSNNHIHVAWYDTASGNWEIHYKKSTNGGSSWITKRLTWYPTHSQHPAIAVGSNDHIHVVWDESFMADSNIYYKKSTNGGTSWTTKRLTWTSGWADSAAIAIDTNNHIHVVWEQQVAGNNEIFYKTSTDGGTTWTTKRLTWYTNSSSTPSIASDSNNHIHVVWYEIASSSMEIIYKKSTNGGVSWTKKRLTWNNGDSYSPSIAVDSSNHIHVVWYDEAPGNYEIFHKMSTDGGSSWSTKRLSWTSGASYNPLIAIDSKDQIHLVWYDHSPGNYEIYYRKGIQ